MAARSSSFLIPSPLSLPSPSPHQRPAMWSATLPRSSRSASRCLGRRCSSPRCACASHLTTLGILPVRCFRQPRGMQPGSMLPLIQLQPCSSNACNPSLRGAGCHRGRRCGHRPQVARRVHPAADPGAHGAAAAAAGLPLPAAAPAAGDVWAGAAGAVRQIQQSRAAGSCCATCVAVHTALPQLRGPRSSVCSTNACSLIGQG